MKAHKQSLLALLLAAILASSCASRRAAQAPPRPVNATVAAANAAAGSTRPRTGDDDRPRVAPMEAAVEAAIAESGLAERATVAVAVMDIATGEWLVAHAPHLRMRPASTQKVVTAVTALDLLGPDYELRTRFCITGQLAGGTLRGDLWVVGAMDPLLTRADLAAAARRLRQAGIQRIEGRVCTDATMKDADKWGWGWCWDDDNPTLTPLLVDGRDEMSRHLPSALRAAGITGAAVGRKPTAGTMPASARELTAVTHPLTAVLRPMLEDSHNLSAEAVFYQVAAVGGTRGASRRQAAIHVGATMQRAGADTALSTVADGSGLSLYNYQTAFTFVRLLAYAATQERILPALYASLPVAAQTGTLRTRMAATAAAANVHAKTGSVSGVSTLVGYTTQQSTGHLLAFAILTNGVTNMAEGRALQDRICALISQ